MQPTIISETPITMAELKDGIAKVRKRDIEGSFRVKRTEEYLSSFTVLTSKDSGAAFEKLMKLGIPRLRDTHVCKLIDLMPKDLNELKLILQGYTITVSNENLKKILDVLSVNNTFI